jgi:hypothetical protein
MEPLTREQKRARNRQVVRDILAISNDREEQIRLWKEKTGRSEKRFYVYKSQVESREFDSELAPE